jgi:hypothetical protein
LKDSRRSFTSFKITTLIVSGLWPTLPYAKPSPGKQSRVARTGGGEGIAIMTEPVCQKRVVRRFVKSLMILQN